MPSPGKRDFDEFAKDYTSIFPLSPVQFGPDGWPIGGWSGISRKEEVYNARIKRAYKIATRDPEIDQSRYIPGAYPDDIVLPEQLVVPPVIAWGTVRLYQSVNMAQHTYSTARKVFGKTRKAASATKKVVIGAIEVIGRVKRRAIQVFHGRSHQEIVRDASRAPSSRAPSSRGSSPNERQRSPRPSSPSLPAPPAAAVQPAPIQHIIESSAHHAVETTFTTSSSSNPLITSTEPLGLFQGLSRNKPQTRDGKSTRAGKNQHRIQSVLNSTVNAGNKVAKIQKLGQWYKSAGSSVVPCPPPSPKVKRAKDRAELVRNIGQHANFGASIASLAPPAASTTALVSPPVIFPPPVVLCPPVADVTYIAAPEEWREPSCVHAVEYAPPPVVVEATPTQPVGHLQVPPVDNGIDPKTASSPIGTYNGNPDISMQDASLLEESLAPPSRRVHWHQSPRTGGPVSSTRIMTPQQSGPFKLIADQVEIFPAAETEAGPSGVGPAAVENATGNKPEPIVPVSESQTSTSVESPAVTVEESATIEAGHVVDAPFEESFGLLEVSQATSQDRRAKIAATKAAKEAERKRREEEAARAKKAAQEAEEKRRKRRFPAKAIIEPLSAEWDAKVNDALSQANTHPVALLRSGFELSRHDFGTALPQSRADGIGYLNDEIINGYAEKVVEYGNGTAGKKDLPRGTVPKVAAFPSFFYTNIRDKGVKTVARWADKRAFGAKKLLEVERVFVPVHEGMHWTLLVLSPKTRTMEYFDSLNGSGTRHFNNIKKWLVQELGDAYVESEWNCFRAKSPQQRNGIDCGVFTVTTAKLIVLGVDPLAFTYKETVLQRRRMLAELMNGGFFGDFEPNVVFKDD